MTAPSEVVNASPPGPSRAMPVNWHLRCVLRIGWLGFPRVGKLYTGKSAISLYVYIGTRKRCGGCAQKAQCTSGPFRYLAIHMHEPARQRARDLAETPAFAHAQRERKKVEALFAELKNQIGLRRLRLRRMKFVREQFFLAAAAQNI